MPQVAIVAPKRLTSRETARRLDVPIQAVYRMIKDGTLKTTPRIGNTRAIILETSVNELIASMCADAQQAS